MKQIKNLINKRMTHETSNSWRTAYIWNPQERPRTFCSYVVRLLLRTTANINESLFYCWKQICVRTQALALSPNYCAGILGDRAHPVPPKIWTLYFDWSLYFKTKISNSVSFLKNTYLSPKEPAHSGGGGLCVGSICSLVVHKIKIGILRLINYVRRQITT